MRPEDSTCLVCGATTHTYRAHTDPRQLWRHGQKQRRLGNEAAYRALQARATELFGRALIAQLSGKQAA